MAQTYRPPTRSTTHGLLLLIGTVVLGLASRRYPTVLPAFVATYAGDVLWVSMVFWLLTLVRPTGEGRHLAAIAFVIAVAVETSQRYHAPWLDAWMDWMLRTRRARRPSWTSTAGK